MRNSFFNSTVVMNVMCVGVIVGTPGKAGAEFVVVNSPVFDYTGNYSDAFGTNGTTEYKQSWSQSFSTEEDYNLSSIRWWGGVNGFFGDGISNVVGFQIIIWNQNFTQQVHNISIYSGSYSQVNTGEFNFFGQEVYEFSSPLNVFLSEGNYNMNIGAWYANPNPGHDQFVWVKGSLSEESSSHYTESASLNGVWGNWREWQGGSFSEGGAFVLTAPSPATVAMIGLAGLVSRRRRN